MKHWFGNAMRGFCMGLADVVPGVSGGTVALILGIYPRLVDAVGSVGAGMLARVPTRAFRAALRRGLRDPAGRGAGPGGVEDPNGVEDPDGVDARRVLLLASVGAGIVPAILVGSEVLPGLLSAYPEQMKGLFLGLVAASVMIPARRIERWRPGRWALAAGAALFTVWFTGLPTSADRLATGTVTLTFAPVASEVRLTPDNLTLEAPATDARPRVLYGPAGSVAVPAGSSTVELEVAARMSGAAANLAPGSIRTAAGPLEVSDVSQRTAIRGGSDPDLLFVFLGGALAISAMSLPGLSGAFVLLLLGLYYFALYSLRLAIHHWDPGAVAVVLTMITGMAVGLLTFARILKALFARWHDGTLAVLVGLMVGSVRELWPFVDHANDGREVLVLPAVADATVMTVALTVAAGVLAVLVLDAAGRRLRAEGDTTPTLETDR